MTDIWFYHLERTSLEQALPELLEKVMSRGWRAYVHGLEDDTIAGLDSHLPSWRMGERTSLSPNASRFCWAGAGSASTAPMSMCRSARPTSRTFVAPSGR